MSSGVKFDGGKPRLDLIPPHALWEIARVFSMGAAKYGDHNWELGIANSRLLAAGSRHELQHRMGITYDEESGLYHLAHAATNYIMALDNMINRAAMDDRSVVRVPSTSGVTTESLDDSRKKANWIAP